MKKIFSALLVLLTITGAANMVSSCKDYDGEITDTKNSVTVLRDSITLLDSKVTASLANAKVAQETADAAVKAAQEAKEAGLTAAEQAQAAATAAATAADEALKQELSAADASLKEELTNNIAKAKEEAVAAAKELIDYDLTNVRDSIANAYKELSTLKTDVTKLKTDVEKLSSDVAKNTGNISNLDSRVTTLESQYRTLSNRFAALVTAYSTMITSVDIFYDVNDDGTVISKPALNFMLAEEKDNDFHGMKFTSGKTTVYGDSLIIRVNPVGAKITKDMVKLMDSENNNLDEFINIESVEQYDDVLSRSAANGLWKIKFKLKDNYSASALTKATGAAFDLNGNLTKYRLFAIGVSTSKSDNLNARCVVSNYSLKVKTGLFNRATDLTINNRSISEISNRVVEGGLGKEKTIASKDATKKDYLWKGAEASKPLTGIPAVSAVTSGSDANVAPNVWDVRCMTNPAKANLTLGYADNKYDMEFDFSSNGTTDGVRGFYVTLDTDYAWAEDGIDPSEREAWLRYKYTNLNKLIEGSKGTVSINETESIKGEEIGFRVYAVNYDGTFVDPDGMAYYVTLGDVAPVKDQSVSGTIVPERKTDGSKKVVIPLASQFTATSNYDAITYNSGDDPDAGGMSTATDLLTGKFTACANKDAANQYHAFNITFMSEADGTGTQISPLKAKSIVVELAEAPNKYLDDETYVIPLKLINNATKEEIYKVNLQIVKKLPTVAGLTKVDDTVLAEGETFLAYVNNGTADLWRTAGSVGYVKLDNIFSGLDSNWSLALRSGTTAIASNSADVTKWNLSNEYILGDGADQAYSVDAIYTDPLSKQADGAAKKWIFSYKSKPVSWWYGATYAYALGDDGQPVTPNIKFGTQSTFSLVNITTSIKVSLPQTSENVSKLLVNNYIRPFNSISSPLAELEGKGSLLFTCGVTYMNPNYVVSFTPIDGMTSQGTFTDNLIISGIDCFGKTVKISVPVTVNE